MLWASEQLGAWPSPWAAVVQAASSLLVSHSRKGGAGADGRHLHLYCIVGVLQQHRKEVLTRVTGVEELLVLFNAMKVTPHGLLVRPRIDVAAASASSSSKPLLVG
jgi:hypothetical protein